MSVQNCLFTIVFIFCQSCFFFQVGFLGFEFVYETLLLCDWFSEFSFSSSDSGFFSFSVFDCRLSCLNEQITSPRISVPVVQARNDLSTREVLIYYSINIYLMKQAWVVKGQIDELHDRNRVRMQQLHQLWDHLTVTKAMLVKPKKNKFRPDLQRSFDYLDLLDVLKARLVSRCFEHQFKLYVPKFLQRVQAVVYQNQEVLYENKMLTMEDGLFYHNLMKFYMLRNDYLNRPQAELINFRKFKAPLPFALNREPLRTVPQSEKIQAFEKELNQASKTMAKPQQKSLQQIFSLLVCLKAIRESAEAVKYTKEQQRLHRLRRLRRLVDMLQQRNDQLIKS